ncbi:MAG: DUF4912 domain-containing protein [Spirochaetaceae bacterium]|jgi:hypothetical protein|nr:DUF4912 domain-containing protein [Spirochaetaceae bacterium]
MDDPRLITRAYLESLTTKDLISLGDSWGIDLPPDLERIFIIEELMEFQAEADEDTAESEVPLRRAEHSELAPLPRQYNRTFIEVLIRDPLWAYIFWEIKSADKDLYEKAPDFEGYCLRIVPVPNSGNPEGGESPFTVSVGIDDIAWYLGFSPGGGRYKVELCVVRNSGRPVLAVSAPFRLPKLLDASGVSGLQKGDNPLISLSGMDEFRVLRNADRLSRIKQ